MDEASTLQAVARETASSNAALFSFAIYLAVVFVLAWLSGQVLKKRKFVNEYFLGSRNLGMWAFALTFAATNASGGSFMGFPSLIYTHGWVLALWIASYMIVPLVTMGLLAKRLNQIARKAKAVTVPEVLRERFASRSVGMTATAVLLFFLFFYLVAQFKAGSSILTILLRDVEVYQQAVNAMGNFTEGIPWVNNAAPDYLLCLLVFAVAVVVYTTYGGFRAVVWTDVMQGLVMVVGVIIMLVLVLSQLGGLGNATRKLADMMPPEKGEAIVRLTAPLDQNLEIRQDAWLALTDESGARNGIVRTGEVALIPAGKLASEPIKILKITTPAEIESIEPDPLSIAIKVEIVSTTPYASGAGKRGVYTSAPGPHADSKVGFLAMGMAFSFYVFWAFGGAGQPSNMVRQMAFKNSATLRRSIVTVAVYYTIIYFSLVVIFVCARIFLPGREMAPDRIMPEMATFLTTAAGVPWLAGLLVAAPFAAVMSSVDSFLLMLSSGVVRDIYQNNINPNAPEKKIRMLTYASTAAIGAAATLAALNPPEFLQTLIVFATGGLAVGFLIPVALTIYWPRMNATGVISGMLGGCGILLILYLVGYKITGKFGPYPLLGLDSFIWGFLGSAILAVGGALATKPPAESLVRKYFRSPSGGN
jgi:Na+/pantothenate symporter